jgi:hypothetical protein
MRGDRGYANVSYQATLKQACQYTYPVGTALSADQWNMASGYVLQAVSAIIQ